eukprot:3095895-Pyramimonas_sp.AAC.1
MLTLSHLPRMLRRIRRNRVSGPLSVTKANSRALCTVGGLPVYRELFSTLHPPDSALWAPESVSQLMCIVCDT